MEKEFEIIEIETEDQFSILKTYGEELTNKKFIINPAISRESEIKKTIVVLLTPEKSALLIGKPGIGKTAIVEGIAYMIQNNDVPNALKGYKIIKINSTSLIGKINHNGKEELIITRLVEELKKVNKVILFIDEIHTLIGGAGNSMDLANILKPALDRGEVKVIGATTDIEYETYIVRDRAFLRRFDKIDILEPDENTTVKILLGSIAKYEKQTGVKMKYNSYINELLCKTIVNATTQYKRVYGLAAMYPDVSLSVLSQAFSLALFDNKEYVDIKDVYNAIKTSKRIYPDTIVKELAKMREDYKDFCDEQGITLPVVTIDEIDPIVE
ncbi:MAG TPA: ATP-dependent Clp protease ATP-binding subunit [Tenericutes bacterium]|nr:ATP-dependent Clp protease ATP-binding subunit [Mycoplasmatota bacterium]